jgi:hypothetical protein
MKMIKQPKQPLARFFSIGVIALALFGLSAPLKGQDAKTNAPAKDPPRSEQATAASGNKQQIGSTNSVSAGAKQIKRPKQLTGAELYSMHCARCHPERYPNDRTSAQWKTVAMHMRVRANLPADHFRKLLKYLQENSGY